MRRTAIGRAGVKATVPPPVAAIVQPIEITSATPINFAPSSTYQITIRLKDVGGAVYDDRTILYSSSNSGIASVSATGLVTAVADGSYTITIVSEGLTATVTGTVTTPVSTVTSLTRTPATLPVTVGLNATVTYTAWSGAGGTGNQLPGGTYTVQTNSDATKASTSITGNVLTVTGLVAGTTNITVRRDGVDAAAVAVTVSAVASGGWTDGLGIYHPSIDPTFLVVQQNLWGSYTGSSVGTIHAGTRYFKNGREGYDTAGSTGSVRIVEDEIAPFQTARDALYTGFGTRCAMFGLSPGAISGSSFAIATSRRLANTGSDGFGAGFAGRKFRKLQHEWVFKIDVGFPALGLYKLLFLNGHATQTGGGPDVSSYSPNVFVTVRPGGTNLDTTPVTPLGFILQGAADDRLVDPGATIQPSVFAATGLSLTQGAPGGVSVTLQRGTIYCLQEEYRTSTGGALIGATSGTPTQTGGQATDGVRDGYLKYTLSSSTDGVNFSTPIVVGFWDDLFTCSGKQVAGKNTYMTSIQIYHQWSGSAITTFSGNDRFGRSGNFDVISLKAIPYQVGSTIGSLASGTVCNLPSKTITANLYSAFLLKVNGAGVLSAVWAPLGNYAGASEARDALPLPGTGFYEVGYNILQAGASDWVEGTDALPGGTGGVPAALVNYRWRSGIIHYSDMWAVGEEE